MYDFPVTDPHLKKLIDPDLPNSPALWAVLKGNHPGNAVVDQVEDPSQWVLRTDAALTYFGNQTGQGFLSQAIAHFREMGPVWLVWPHQTSLQPPEITPAEIVQRLEFSKCDPDSEVLNELRKQIPKDLAIQAIDEGLFERCEWRDEMAFYAGSRSNFLAHGIGLCLMQGKKIIAETYASALGKTRAEIGAITREAYRGQGYAPIACAYMIETCRQRGYEAYWSCDADHRASIRVAQKLGYQEERAYQIIEYDSTV